jgi:organic radical activating enzyme
MGRRAGFVRLGRCNLDCTWCDTPYTWDWERFDPAVEVRKVPIAQIVEQLAAMDPEIVVVTGGEPLLQQRSLVPLLEACTARGWPVEVETNGTLAPAPSMAELVAQWNVSPKLANSGIAEERRIVPEALAALQATGRALFKLVVGSEAELDEVAELVARVGLAPIWIMPEGTDRADLLERAQALADPVTARGWNLTTRLHVLLWGDERGR